MTIVRTGVIGAAPVTQAAAAAPTTSEVVTDVNWGTILEFDIGGTSTTITVVRPGNMAQGDAITDYVIGPVTSTRRALRLGPFADSNGDATVQFSQVTAVTARVWDT
jgi:hypothetical protein